MSSQECENKFCKRYVKTLREVTDKFVDKSIKEYPKKLRDIENKLKNSNKLTKQEIEYLHAQKNAIASSMASLKNIKKNKNNTDKIELDNCKNDYCNATCKNTMYEPGNKLSKSFVKRLKLKTSETYFHTRRKEIFGNKTNVLKDGFYEKISSRDVNEMKKLGAISGCVSTWEGMKKFFKKNANKTRRKRNH
jgi:hypothetical protein